jgi:hypothetical protein
MESEAKRPKLLIEKIEILDESTGQIILKEKTRYVYSKNDCGDNDIDNVRIKCHFEWTWISILK